MAVFLTLLPMLDGGNSNRHPAATLLCMEPTRVGRKLGIGVRVASGMFRDRASQAAHSMQQEAPAYAARSAQTGRAVATGAKNFGRSVWGPFAHAGGVLWLEITGLFFFLFGIFFAQGAYRMRHAWSASGPSHTRLILYAVVAVVFFYFTFSSFYRARRKEKHKRMQAQTR
jgi:hypothetical protein